MTTLIHRLLSTVWDKPLPALLICAGDTSSFAKLIDPSFGNTPSGSRFFDRHIGTPPLQFVKNIITTVPNKINYIVPNNNDIIRNSFILQIFCSFSSYFLLSVILFVCQKEAMICRKKIP